MKFRVMGFLAIFFQRFADLFERRVISIERNGDYGCPLYYCFGVGSSLLLDKHLRLTLTHYFNSPVYSFFARCFAFFMTTSSLAFIQSEMWEGVDALRMCHRAISKLYKSYLQDMKGIFWPHESNVHGNCFQMLPFFIFTKR